MFDELKIKKILKNELTKDIYLSLPDKFKIEQRVITHLIKDNPSLISIVPEFVDISIYIENDYNLINYLSKKQLNSCINKIDITKINITRELFENLSISNQNKLFEKVPNICINYYDWSRKRELIYNIINSYNDDYNSLFRNIFTEEELQNIVFNLSTEEFIDLFSYKIVKKYILNILINMNEEKIDKILPLLNESEVYVELPIDLRNKIDIKNANGNLEVIINLPSDVQIEYFLQNIDELIYAERDIRIDCLMKYNKIDADILLKNNVCFSGELINNLSLEEQEKLISRNYKRIYMPFDSNRGYLFFNKIMEEKISKIAVLEKREKILNLYKSLNETNVEVGDRYLYHNQKYQIGRLLYNTDIVNNNSVALLEQYKNTYDRNLLIKILSNAYGEHVIEIFKERPFLDLLDIENFLIFDKEIYERLGKNFINYLLNCDLYNLSDFIGKIALDKVVLDKFSNYFNFMIKDLNNLDVNIITNIIEKFIIYEEVINDINYTNIDNTTKQNLQLLINDDIMFSIDVHTLKDLQNYRELRKKRYIKIENNLVHIDDLKNLIFAFVFGRSVSDDTLLEQLSFEKALKVFNISNIIENKDLIREMNISKDEEFMLMLVHEMMYKNNSNELKNTFEAIINRNLDSVLFANTFEKIKNYYIEDIKAHLLSNSKIDKLDKNIVDGIEVVTLNGDEFTTICSVTGLGLSSGGNIRKAKYGRELLIEWLNRENGYNAIATAVVASDTSIYPIEKDVFEIINESVVFVFGDDISIIGMGGSDIASEHTKRSSVHTFDYIGTPDKDNAFSTMSELKNRINENMSSNKTNLRGAKFNSEITITRREEDIRKEKGGLKRTMPIGIYVIGEIKPYHLETAKIFNSYYEKNGLGQFRIIQVNPTMYKGNNYKLNNDLEKIGDDVRGKSI